MRAVVLHADDEFPGLRLEEYPKPTPRHGEVLIQVAASPINPSDLAGLSGAFGPPRLVGKEGSGTVVAAGGGLLAGRLVGRRVGFAVAQGGAWAEFVAAPTAQCVELPEQVSLEQGAMSFVNPVAALAMMDIAHREQARAVVNTAAASALGRMFHRLSLRDGLAVIHVVRRSEQVALLKEQGAAHVLNSSEADFAQALAAMCRQLDARIAFDAVGGEMPGRLLAAMPAPSRVVLYGRLSTTPGQMEPGELTTGGGSVEWLHIVPWLASKSPLYQIGVMRTLQRLLATDLRSEICMTVPFENVSEAISQYTSGMTRGKVILKPRL